MENRFLGLIEKSVKVHWDLPAFTDMEGSTLLYKDVARRMEELHILFRCAEIQPGDKIAILGRNSSNWVSLALLPTEPWLCPFSMNSKQTIFI